MSYYTVSYTVSVLPVSNVRDIVVYRSRTSYDGTWNITEGRDSIGYFTRVYRHGTTSVWRHDTMYAMQRSYDRFLRNREHRFLGIF